ncbi:MAG TPA: outer membrane protein assembly factor BamA, partial [Steroidobacteraceae bacterium]
LRREMRQLEGAWMSNVALERSKQRIQRLPYVKKVEFETTPVPGTPDLVDVNFEVEEGPSAQLGGGIGYSEAQSVILNGNFIDSNFLGTGQRIAAEINGGRYATHYSFSHTDPYTTIDGVSRTINLLYRDITQYTSETSDFATRTWLLGAEYGYPISERQGVNFGLSWQHVELATTTGSSQQLRDWVKANGESTSVDFGTFELVNTRFRAVELNLGWVFDSRDRVLFPTQGALHRVSTGVAVPGSEVQWLSALYQYEQFLRLPIIDFLPLRIAARVGYARALGDTTAVPPHRHFYMGGPDSVRGFRETTLGPRDSLGNPYGGDLAVSGQAEIILPMPRKFASSARVTLFYDFGQAFYLGDTEFTDKGGFPVDYSFDVRELRTSVGIGVQWLAPLGLFRFSYALPLRYRQETELDYGDELERFQFSIGQAF